MSRTFNTRKTLRRSVALRQSKTRSFETMEDRRVMAAGDILFDGGTGKLTIHGSDFHADTVNVTIDRKGTSATADDVVRVELKNTGAPLVKEILLYDHTKFDFYATTTTTTFAKTAETDTRALPTLATISGVKEIIFNGNGGSDFINNLTHIKLRGNGGAGHDVMLGGSADDVFLGGEGNDYIDGRLGGDMIWGEGGVDALFGDAGVDMILGGALSDYIHGGSGDDSLYGEDGNDWLFGGAGADNLFGNAGTNTLKADYGTTGITVSGFETWDWFDRNLQDASLRSLSRLLYRDGTFQRADMFKLYDQVKQSGLVTTAEFNDLKDLTSKYLVMWQGVRSLAKNVAEGDRANNWYQGSTLGNLTAGCTGLHLERLVNKWFLGLDRPATGSTYQYVSGSLYRNGITYSDIDQEGAADCYMLAPLAEVALKKASTILNMITDNGDGTFTIRFFNGSTSEYVTVDRFLPTDGNGTSTYAGFGGRYWDSTNELWVALVEKAYAQINESNWIGQDGTNTYAGIDFGQASKAFKHITGKSSGNMSTLDFGLPAGMSMKSYVLNMMSAGKAITFSSHDSGVASNIVANHVYALLGYNATTKKFKLFNPWGYNNSKPGEIELSWSQIVGDFGRWTYASV